MNDPQIVEVKRTFNVGNMLICATAFFVTLAWCMSYYGTAESNKQMFSYLQSVPGCQNCISIPILSIAGVFDSTHAVNTFFSATKGNSGSISISRVYKTLYDREFLFGGPHYFLQVCDVESCVSPLIAKSYFQEAGYIARMGVIPLGNVSNVELMKSYLQTQGFYTNKSANNFSNNVVYGSLTQETKATLCSLPQFQCEPLSDELVVNKENFKILNFDTIDLGIGVVDYNIIELNSKYSVATLTFLEGLLESTKYTFANLVIVVYSSPLTELITRAAQNLSEQRLLTVNTVFNHCLFNITQVDRSVTRFPCALLVLSERGELDNEKLLENGFNFSKTVDDFLGTHTKKENTPFPDVTEHNDKGSDLKYLFLLIPISISVFLLRNTFRRCKIR